MYAKLVFRNVKRSIKDYLIYIVTMTICVTLFYAFLSISSSYYNPDVGSEYDFSLLSDGMKVAICMITFLLLFLIAFVNNYMLTRKQKEFALESIMGMEQRTIGWMFFAETMIMGAISILIGILLGVFCSQFITATLLKSYGKPYQITWTLFPDTVFLTVVFFMVSLFVVGLFNGNTIRKIKIIDMISAENKNEPIFKRGRWIFVVSIVFLAFTLWELFAGIQKIKFYYDSRFTFPVKIMYWGNVLLPIITFLWALLWGCKRKEYSFQKLIYGLLICSALDALFAASVPTLTNYYYLPLHGGIINQYLLFVVIDLLFFICALIYLASSMIIAWKEKSPEHRYHEENLFFFGQISSKLNTTSKTMAIISITLVLAIFMFVSAPILIGWASGYLDVRALYDIQVFSEYNDVYDEESLPIDKYQIITDFLDDNQISRTYDCTFNLYLPRRNEFHDRAKHAFPIVALSLSDYNYIREMLGYNPISLGDGEFSTQWKTIATDEDSESFLSDLTCIETDAGMLRLSRNNCYKEPIGETVYNSYTNVVYIFPDSVCDQLLPVMTNRYIKTAEKISYENAKRLEQLFSENYPEDNDSGAYYGIRFKTLQTNSAIANNFVLQAALIYGAVVLMIICLTVLSLQLILDAAQYKYRFSVLRKIGVDEEHISKLILKQLIFWFGLPIIVAVIVSTVIIAYFIQSISAEIAAYIGFDVLIQQIGGIVGILFLLLVCYFMSTWILFKQSVN